MSREEAAGVAGVLAVTGRQLRRVLGHGPALRLRWLPRTALKGRPIVLAGHSYGGAVITNAAVGDPEVSALVYVDAFIPQRGDTIGALARGSPTSPASPVAGIWPTCS